MGARGFKPKPNELKLLAGGRVNKHAPIPVSRSVGDPPEYLDDCGKAKWHELAAQLGELGVLAASDASILTLYCATWSLWRQASDRVRDEGLTVASGEGSPKTNPCYHIASDALKTLLRIGTECGMSPSARGSVKTTGTPTGDNPLAKFLTKR